MAFYKIDPTLYSITVNLGTYGIQPGDLVFVQLVGGFEPSPFLPDGYQNSVVNYAGNSDNVNSGYILPIAAGLNLEIINLDTPLADNTDPNGDYGLEIDLVTAGLSKSVPQDLNVGATGAGTFTDPGGSLIANTFTVSAGSSLSISDDGEIGATYGVLIGGAGGGTVAVTSGELIANGGLLTVGAEGDGLLTAASGGTVALAGSGYIDIGAGQSGSVVIAGGSLSLAQGTGGIAIGDATDGMLEVSNSGTAQINGGGLGVAYGAGVTGLLLIDGANSLLEEGLASTGMGIGQGGDGTVIVADGGTIVLSGTGTSSGIGIGQRTTGSGTLQVSGAGSLLELTTPNSGIAVGKAGTGVLSVTNGGAVRLDRSGIAVGDAGTSGTLLVSGSGSALKTVGTLPGTGITVGKGGKGTLTVTNSAVLLDGAGLAIADGAGAAGTAAVNSASLTAGWMNIGANGGDGTLTVVNDGHVTLPGISSNGSITVGGGTYGVLEVGVSGTGSLMIDSGGFLFAAGATIGSHGTVELNGGTVGSPGLTLDAAAIVSGDGAIQTSAIGNDGGTVIATSGSLSVLGTIAGSGSLVIGPWGTLDLSLATLTGGLFQPITFSDATGTLDISQSSASAPIDDFRAGNEINLFVPGLQQGLWDIGYYAGYTEIFVFTTLNLTEPYAEIALQGTYEPFGLTVGYGSSSNGSTFVSYGYAPDQASDALSLTQSFLVSLTDDFLKNITSMSGQEWLEWASGSAEFLQHLLDVARNVDEVDLGPVSTAQQLATAIYEYKSGKLTDAQYYTKIARAAAALLPGGDLAVDVGNLLVKTIIDAYFDAANPYLQGMQQNFNGQPFNVITPPSGGTIIQIGGTSGVPMLQTLTLDTTKPNVVESFVSLPTVPTGIKFISLQGSADITAIANNGGDGISPNSGNDVLVGGLGNDIFYPGTGTITYEGTEAQLNGDEIVDLKPGDTIQIDGVRLGQGEISVDPQTNSIVIQAAATLSVDNLSQLTASGAELLVVPDSTGTEATFTALCFCADTLIATPQGPTKVQDLAVGGLVTAWSGAARSIVWIGAGSVLATRGRRNAATPVIVRKGALADGMPYRDLRVTKGHSFYLDNVLIPVEFLVNHRSIIWDDHAQEVQLYHIELAQHDILLANGAPAESYRDDGNRWLFRNANTGWDQPPKPPCAQILTGGPIVDAIWRRLLERAGPRPSLPLTDDPDVHLLVDGRRVDALSHHGEAYIFSLSTGPLTVRVASRSGTPAELGLVRDMRELGVAVRCISLRQATRFRVLQASDARLTDGFYDYEEDNDFRWTNGDALLPEELFANVTGPMQLVLLVGCTTQYIDYGTPVMIA